MCPLGTQFITGDNGKRERQQVSLNAQKKFVNSQKIQQDCQEAYGIKSSIYENSKTHGSNDLPGHNINPKASQMMCAEPVGSPETSSRSRKLAHAKGGTTIYEEVRLLASWVVF